MKVMLLDAQSYSRREGNRFIVEKRAEIVVKWRNVKKYKTKRIMFSALYFLQISPDSCEQHFNM